MEPTSPEPVFLNLEYFFFLAYRALAKVFSYLFSIEFLYLIKIVATILIILLIAAICYCLVRIYEMKAEDKAKAVSVSPVPAAVATGGVPDTAVAGPKRSEAWERVRDKMLSENPSDWRLAIIEADIYMDRCLDAAGYYGETVGDKLKGIAAGQLGSVQVAWEAHKVRNRIAHDGADFVLTQPEVRRVLSYYEIVFRDLGVIE